MLLWTYDSVTLLDSIKESYFMTLWKYIGMPLLSRGANRSKSIGFYDKLGIIGNSWYTNIFSQYYCISMYVYNVILFIFKQFTVTETKRQKAEKLKLSLKHEAQMNELEAKMNGNMKELTQLQNEKRRLLVEHESEKLKKLDEHFAEELGVWKDQLAPRKKVALKNVFSFPLVGFGTVFFFLKLIDAFEIL